MAQLLEMPKLSDTMKEGVLRRWQKKEGDKISPGEVVAEVETDKATMDFESFDEGVLLKLLVADGATVPVGGPIAIIGKPGEDISAALAEAEKRQKAAAPAATPSTPAATPSTPAATQPVTRATAPAGPKPTPQPAASKAPAAARPTQRPSAAVPANGTSGKVLASPLARRLATDLGIDLRAVQGTGPGGRIVERDVQAAADGPATAPTSSGPEAEAETPAGASGEETPRADGSLPHPLVPDRRAETRPATAAPSTQDQLIPLSLMRKTIARRLVESKTQVPHFYLSADADMESAMSFREQVKEVHGAKLSVNDLIIKAAALALRRVPESNASFSDEGIIRHGRVDIGMAVAIEDGLVTPVIRNADLKTLGQIAGQAQELAARARERKLKPEEMTGATFSVSNLGMMGIREFAAIINPPEGAILAVGSIRKEPVVKNDQIVIGQRMTLTLSCDHRVVDGALGARLLAAIISILERPITLAF
jgi:pyruvate dehydrogenase E2 component (dihydrolipoamide acetyltransferase)